VCSDKLTQYCVANTGRDLTLDAAPAITYVCAATPTACQTSPPMCACLVAHQGCALPDIIPLGCSVMGGVAYMTCAEP
jgi:hypothetical protein